MTTVLADTTALPSLEQLLEERASSVHVWSRHEAVWTQREQSEVVGLAVADIRAGIDWPS